MIARDLVRPSPPTMTEGAVGKTAAARNQSALVGMRTVKSKYLEKSNNGIVQLFVRQWQAPAGGTLLLLLLLLCTAATAGHKKALHKRTVYRKKKGKCMYCKEGLLCLQLYSTLAAHLSASCGSRTGSA